MKRIAIAIFALLVFSVCPAACAQQPANGVHYGVPILLYHRFADPSTNLMTVTTREFHEQMETIKKEGYKVIPLRQLIDAYTGKGPFPAPGSVVIVVDDAHRSFYESGYRTLKRYGYPSTLFVYPSCISRASYAMTWDQLRAVDRDGVDVQSHTYYHPNFKVEARKQPPADYQKFVEDQLKKSKSTIEGKLEKQVRYLAYPFGLFDDVVERKVVETGYEAAFTIVRKPNLPDGDRKKLHRYLIEPRLGMKEFRKILETSRPS